MHLWLKKNHNTESWNIYFYKPWYFQKEYNWLKLHYSLKFLPVKNFQFLQYMTWEYLLTIFGKIKRSDVQICREPPNPLRYAVKLLYWERKYFFNYTWFYYLLRLVVRHNMELSTINLLNIKHVEIWIKKSKIISIDIPFRNSQRRYTWNTLSKSHSTLLYIWCFGNGHYIVLDPQGIHNRPWSVPLKHISKQLSIGTLIRWFIACYLMLFNLNY